MTTRVTINDLAEVGKQLHQCRSQLGGATRIAKEAAIQAVSEGYSEVAVARALGVDRARTLRRWLGKG
jgi:transposase-like protein